MLTSDDYPYLQVRITVRAQSFTYRALLDTGFDGYLVIPEILQSELGAAVFQVKTRLADGSESMRPHYHGGIELVGLNLGFLAPIMLLGDECLMGQGVMRQLKVTFDHGRQVIVEP